MFQIIEKRKEKKKINIINNYNITTNHESRSKREIKELNVNRQQREKQRIISVAL